VALVAQPADSERRAMNGKEQKKPKKAQKKGKGKAGAKE